VQGRRRRCRRRPVQYLNDILEDVSKVGARRKKYQYPKAGNSLPGQPARLTQPPFGRLFSPSRNISALPNPGVGHRDRITL